MSKLKKQFFILFYIFIIFNSMLPNNNNNYQSLRYLNTIIPGIDKNYNNSNENTKKEYSFKLFEIIQDIF